MILHFYKDRKEMMAILKHIGFQWEKIVSILIKKDKSSVVLQASNVNYWEWKSKSR